MKEIALIFPHQLFEHHPSLVQGREVWLVEEYLFFRKCRFHIQKLILHRASMKAYEALLTKRGHTVKYIESTDLTTRSSLAKKIDKAGIQKVHMCELVDDWLTRAINSAVAKCVWYETPMFMTSVADYTAFFAKQKKPFMKTFYEWQRKRLAILMDKSGKPVGGMYSFDTENRKKLPRAYQEPNIPDFTKKDTVYVDEARTYVTTYFKKSYGNIGSFVYAITHKSAQEALQDFVAHRLQDFGIYEDAITSIHQTLNHSVLSPYLNIGLLTPHECVQAVLSAYEQGKAPLNSVEGFIRQIIGWREFIRVMYMLHGRTTRTKNFWNHTKLLDESWWQGITGILPIDNAIKNCLGSAYNHHIERLMIIGNYMLLSEIHPREAYIWFMEMYIDAYDWVMVPNVYGMSQFADGGIFATKPYISGSNYIIKMSDYKKGAWSEDWDKKFWQFLEKHEVFFMKNIRMRMLLQARKNRLLKK